MVRVKGKDKRLPLTSHGVSEEGKNVGRPSLTLTFGTIRMAELSAIGAGRTLPRKEIFLVQKD